MAPERTGTMRLSDSAAAARCIRDNLCRAVRGQVPLPPPSPSPSAKRYFCSSRESNKYTAHSPRDPPFPGKFTPSPSPGDDSFDAAQNSNSPSAPVQQEIQQLSCKPFQIQSTDGEVFLSGRVVRHPTPASLVGFDVASHGSVRVQGVNEEAVVKTSGEMSLLGESNKAGETTTTSVAGFQWLPEDDASVDKEEGNEQDAPPISQRRIASPYHVSFAVGGEVSECCDKKIDKDFRKSAHKPQGNNCVARSGMLDRRWLREIERQVRIAAMASKVPTKQRRKVCSPISNSFAIRGRFDAPAAAKQFPASMAFAQKCPRCNTPHCTRSFRTEALGAPRVVAGAVVAHLPRCFGNGIKVTRSREMGRDVQAAKIDAQLFPDKPPGSPMLSIASVVPCNKDIPISEMKKRLQYKSEVGSPSQSKATEEGSPYHTKSEESEVVVTDLDTTADTEVHQGMFGLASSELTKLSLSRELHKQRLNLPRPPPEPPQNSPRHRRRSVTEADNGEGSSNDRTVSDGSFPGSVSESSIAAGASTSFIQHDTSDCFELLDFDCTGMADSLTSETRDCVPPGVFIVADAALLPAGIER
eukprot:TRINITY_DN60757_c0_g1_i1.p1 TRINITY_DN60757_c0_g1~~TRINITY_DN60757_c0_g1_i1.p1  ORF type:complete len:598 (-),score=66.09 TRINITY_DN60757_c0_g1_i1:184-1935(-)